MGRSGVGDTPGGAGPRGEGRADDVRSGRNFGPRNPDGTWVGGVERGSSKPLPFPVGHRFGELTCLRWDARGVHQKHGGHYMQPWLQCSCGWEGYVDRSNLRAGRTTRCNACAREKSRATKMAQRGLASICPDPVLRDRLLDRISAIIVRCTNPLSAAFPDYGGRGITVHPPWVEDRSAFLRYLVGLPGHDQQQLQLDRTDNDKGYAPGNLRFVTRSANMANKRRITAREVVELRRRIAALEAENADLRHRYGGAAQ